MNESGLEEKVHAEAKSKPSLRARAQSLWDNRREFAKNYVAKWKVMERDLILPTTLSAIVAGAAKQYAESKGAGEVLKTLSPYAGYLIAYPTYFIMHYKNNKEKYPDGVLSKKFVSYAGHFVASDYLSDPIFASPVLLGTSYLLGQNENVLPFVAGASAAILATMSWMSAMVIVQPTMEALTGKINRTLKKYVGPIVRVPYETIRNAISSEKKPSA